MITGDNKRTAEAICRNIGVFGERECTDGLSFEGEELMKMTKVRCQVARASPALCLVDCSWQTREAFTNLPAV